MLVPAAVIVPGSTSNLGAGFDCVGLAVRRRLTAGFEPGGDGLRLSLEGTLAGLPESPAEDLVARAFAARLEARGAGPPRGTLTVTSEIPVGRGLGASGAAVVAGLALADAAVGGTGGPSDRGGPFDREALLDEAWRVEGHGDNVAPSLLGGLVGVVPRPGGGVLALPLPLSPDVGFAFAAPGVSISTAEARAALPDGYRRGVAVSGLGRLVALLHGLARADAEALRIAFADELHVPYRLPLVPGGDAALEAAVRTGAWAVTISGSGSGLVAVCPPEAAGAVAGAMAAAFREVGAGGGEGVVGFSLEPEPEGVRTARIGTDARTGGGA